MRMRLQELKSFSDTPLHVTKHLDLSDKEIVAIEGLHHCPLLESLTLTCNYIDMLCNLDCCRNLWQLDLTGNKVKSLLGIGQFPSLGGLLLAYNDISWRELHRLHHMHILQLSLIGNPQLDSDPYYRQHVISMLPHVWMLDGLLITAGERSKVIKFFHNSKNSTRPVWCKSSRDNFIPSTMKNLFVRGKFGPKTAHMMQHFPIHCTHTAELDWRRLGYLGDSMEDQLQLETKTELPLLRLILGSRHGDEGVDQCNMLLLLLLAALKYKLPAVAMAAAYNIAKLEQLCAGVEHIEMLSSHVQLQLASLLLSAVLIDHDTKSNRVLSHLLLNSIMSTFQTVQREIQAERANRPLCRSEIKKSDDKFNDSILAAEVVQMFCLVPTFIDILIHQSNAGVIKLVTMATKNSEIMETITTIATSSPNKQQQNVALYLMDAVKHNVLIRKQKPITKLKQRRHSTPAIGCHDNTTLYTTRIKSAGDMIRCRLTTDVKESRTITTGDIVLLGDQGMVAKVISEQDHLILLQTVNEVKNHFYYVNIKNVTWDQTSGCWQTDMKWLDSSVDITTLTTQSIVSDDEVFAASSCSNHGDYTEEEIATKGNRKISLLIDMSDKSVHDMENDTIATDTTVIDPTNSSNIPTSPLRHVWERDSSVSSKVDLSTDYRIMQRQQLKNNDVYLVEPHPPPTSPTNPSHTQVIMRNIWGPLHHDQQNRITKHTLTSYNRLLYCRKQQRPIKSTRSSGTIILEQSKSPQPIANYRERMPIHHATKSLLNARTLNWKSPPTSTVPPSTRKLGNILTINGSPL